MRYTARFWRNVTLIAIMHLLALVALLRWASGSKITRAEEITWFYTADEAIATADAVDSEETPTTEPVRHPSPADENQSATAPLKSEIQIPTATPRATAAPTAIPSLAPKVTSRPTPGKKASPKPSATPEKT